MKTTPSTTPVFQVIGRGNTAEKVSRSTGAQLPQRNPGRRHPRGTPPTELECDSIESWLKVDSIDESDEELRVRVRQRIQQRLTELRAAAEPATVTSSLRELKENPTPDTEHREIESLHEDVVLTAAQILERYLEKNQRGDSLELTLVHRMLVKEVELQALSRQRGTQKNK